jgi:hypothetical protein
MYRIGFQFQITHNISNSIAECRLQEVSEQTIGKPCIEGKLHRKEYLKKEDGDKRSCLV